MYDNARAGARGVGIGIYSGSRTLVCNNLVWGNQLGIALDYDVASVGVFHNVLVQNAGDGIYVGSGSTGATVQNNIVYQNGSPISDVGTASTLGSNLEGVDALFVDAAGRDFHLTAGSPAIDKGVPLAAVASDFDGVVRPQGSAYDIGAFEFCAGGCARPDGGGGTSGDAGADAMAGGAGVAGAGGTADSGAGSGPGGSSSGAGGTRGGPQGSTGSGNAAGSEDGGCGCRMTERRSVPLPFALFGALLVLRRSRRKRRDTGN